MTPIEEICFWTSIFLYVCASFLYVAGFIFKKGKWPGWGTRITFAAFLAHTVAIASRWMAAGHPPVMRNYENSMAGAWVIILFYLLAVWRFRKIELTGISTVPIALLMLGYGVMNYPELEPFTPPHKSGWLYVHVVFAWLAYMSFVIAFGLALLYLLKDRRGETGFLGRVPELGVLDELSYRFVAFGFIMDTVMVVAGSIWASKLWGSYWNWDPIETWSLISWLIYALYLHLRVTMGWRGRKAAWLAVFALSGVILSFWGVNYIAGGFHIFNLI